MIILEKNQIIQGDQVDTILRFEVVFQTPFGWCSALKEATEYCETKGLDPAMCVVPVPRAIGHFLSEVIR